jgi:hypothetical protein
MGGWAKGVCQADLLEAVQMVRDAVAWNFDDLWLGMGMLI